ncbi:MAG TPA: hypothetical protein VEB21_14965 [Terriglobales bacterium]|nr:hypothetical protein [Terriglobales bacterium]
MTVDELVSLVNIAAGMQPMDECLAADADANGEVTVEEIVAAMRRLLDGCVVEMVSD